MKQENTHTTDTLGLGMCVYIFLHNQAEQPTDIEEFGRDCQNDISKEVAILSSMLKLEMR